MDSFRDDCLVDIKTVKQINKINMYTFSVHEIIDPPQTAIGVATQQIYCCICFQIIYDFLGKMGKTDRDYFSEIFYLHVVLSSVGYGNANGITTEQKLV